MIDRFKIGVISKPQGVRGELKVQPLTDDISRFKKLKEVIIDDVTFSVSSSKVCDGFAIVALSAVTDRNTAESMRGKFLCVDRKDAITLPKGRFFIADIIGVAVVDEEGTFYGNVVSVTSARTDIFTIEKGEKVARFPFLKDALIGVDLENKKVTVKKKRFQEIVCYEN